MNPDKIYRFENRHYEYVVKDAHYLIEEAIKRYPGNVAVAVSGGKDSVPLGHLVKQHCDPLIIWNDSGLELPESREIIEQLCKQLDCQLAIAKGDAINVWSANKGFRNDAKVDRECIINPTISVLKQYDISLEFVGLREEESKGRKIIIRKYGGIHQNKKWGCATAWPLRKWKAQDSLAYIDEFNLPLHPAYNRVFGKERHEIRVSWVYDGMWANRGSAIYCRKFYPKIYLKLREVGIL